MFHPLPATTLSRLLSTGIASIDYETLLESHYSKWLRPGDVAVDVGAHSGRHLAKLLEAVGPSGRVFAFEPLPDKFDDLTRNFDRPNVFLHNAALAREAGLCQFTHAQGAPQESGLRERRYNDPDKARPRKIEVQVQKLDALLAQLKTLAFIKIDIEGGEIDCLRGAMRVIDTYRPVISVEYGHQSYSVYGNTKWTLFDLCDELGYTLYDMFLNRLASRQIWGSAVDSIYWDYLMVPREKESIFLDRMGRGDPSPCSGYAPLATQSFRLDAAPTITLLQGFSSPEEWGYWTEGWHASLRLTLAEPPRHDLLLVLSAHGYVNERHPFTEAAVRVNGVDVGVMPFDAAQGMRDAETFRFPVPREGVVGNSFVVDLHVRNPACPAALGLSEDPRWLGVGLHEVGLWERLGCHARDIAT